MPEFYEFFAGGGMARMGLGPDWRPTLVNDCDAKKVAAYQRNWGAEEPVDARPVQDISVADLPGQADLAWASFPCQDLSLAGVGAGLAGARSGSFWAFWDLIRALVDEGRAPRLIVLENVTGLLTSHQGQDFAALSQALAKGGYRFGALVIDARHFLPQSRPRLFVIAQRMDAPRPPECRLDEPSEPYHTKGLRQAWDQLEPSIRQHWVWWRLPIPTDAVPSLTDLIDFNPDAAKWHTAEQTDALLALMTYAHRAKIEAVQASGQRTVGTIYRRTRIDENGQRRQRAEIRFDGVAGCLRTPGGGSSRQTLAIIDGSLLRTRLLSAREAARLMGLPDDYQLPARYNEAYHLIGDGVAVPAVRHLTEHLLAPLLHREPALVK